LFGTVQSMTFKAKSRGEKMSVQLVIDVDDWLIEGKDPKKVEEQMKNALILDEYKNGDISIGQIAEHTGRTIEEAMEWVSSHRLSSTDTLTPEILAITKQNRIAHIKKLKESRQSKQ